MCSSTRCLLAFSFCEAALVLIAVQQRTHALQKRCIKVKADLKTRADKD